MYTSNNISKNISNLDLSKQAYQNIIEMISNGTLKMGQIITESAMKDKLGMSKTPIREAFASLQFEGVITKTGRSYSIIYPEKEEIDEIYEFKCEVEALAAYFAAKRMTTEERKDLSRTSLEIINENKNKGDPVKLANLSGMLHELIAKGSKNELIRKDISSMRLKLRIVRISLFASMERQNAELAEHMLIVNAILEGNAEKARKAMYNHQKDVWEYVKDKVIPRLYY
jgi:DNA-binding GntR family transcriptional regulator